MNRAWGKQVKRILTCINILWTGALHNIDIISPVLWMANLSQFRQTHWFNSLKAVSDDSRNDTLATGAVLTSSFVSHFTGINLDGWTGLGVAVFIIYNGISLIKETLSPLLGEAPSRELIAYIAEKILSYENVLGIHDIIVHDYGPNRRYVSAHVEMPSDGDVLITHGIIDEIEKSFLENDGIHLIIHHDPIHPGEDILQ